MTGPHCQRFVKVNRDAGCDKTYRELSRALYRQTGVRVYASTSKRMTDYWKWRFEPMYSAPHLTEEQMSVCFSHLPVEGTENIVGTDERKMPKTSMPPSYRRSRSKTAELASRIGSRLAPRSVL